MGAGHSRSNGGVHHPAEISLHEHRSTLIAQSAVCQKSSVRSSTIMTAKSRRVTGHLKAAGRQSGSGFLDRAHAKCM